MCHSSQRIKPSSFSFQDPRYNTTVDQIVGYTTDSLLCMPCRSSDGEILGVAQVINKNTNEGCFSKDDEKVRVNYSKEYALFHYVKKDAYSIMKDMRQK